MKKVGIITIIDDNNYGNRLQNYATQEIVKKLGLECFTLKNHVRCNYKDNSLKISLLFIMKEIQNSLNRLKRIDRYKQFKEFNKNINFYNKTLTSVNAKKIDEHFDYYITGSDQIWNIGFRRSTYIDMLDFTTMDKKIAFSPSFGISNIPDKYKDSVAKSLSDYKKLSVREDRGKEIIFELIGRNDVEVLLDPTMLLTSDEWDRIAKKPIQLKCKKFILNYFLGNLSDERKHEIERIAKENNCEIINILDKNSPFYNTGPSEFLYLEKNAFLICTDSFHSSVFAILYDRPFLVFDREGNGHGMNSRIETLISKFKLKDRKYEGKISKKNLEHDYSEAFKMLDKERIKSQKYLVDAMDIDKER